MNTREQRFVFDEVAALYARVRPSYPSALIEDVISECALRPGARILELGAGPGNASVLFAGRGFELTCLEPGARLAEVARQRLSSDARASVQVTTFEDWVLEPEAFDLVFAAQSFHWIDPAIRFAKAARALRPGGNLAVFANRPLPGSTSVHARIQEAYAEHMPHFAARVFDKPERGDLLRLFSAATEFGQAQMREYAWRAEYDAARYLDLMRTQSDHRLLPADRLDRLLEQIRSAIEAAGGHFGVDYVAALCWAAPRGR